MKDYLKIGSLGAALGLCVYIVLFFPGCANLAYQTIGSAEAAVSSVNSAYLDGVVTGQIPTNSVPQVEAAFNDTQLTLHSAAVIAAGGDKAPIPALANAKVVAFTNLVNSVKFK